MHFHGIGTFDRQEDGVETKVNPIIIGELMKNARKVVQKMRMAQTFKYLCSDFLTPLM